VRLGRETASSSIHSRTRTKFDDGAADFDPKPRSGYARLRRFRGSLAARVSFASL
jgi:hypothetical protein